MPAYNWQTDPFGYMGDNSPNFIAAGQPEYVRGDLNSEARRIQQGEAPTYNPILAQGFNTIPAYDINKGQSYGEFLARETARTQAGANSGPYTNNPTLAFNFLNQNSNAIPTGPFRLPTYQDEKGINYAIRPGMTSLPAGARNATPNWQQLIGGGAAGWGNPGAPTFQPGQNIFAAPPVSDQDQEVNPNPVIGEINRGGASEDTYVPTRNLGYDDTQSFSGNSSGLPNLFQTSTYSGLDNPNQIFSGGYTSGVNPNELDPYSELQYRINSGTNAFSGNPSGLPNIFQTATYAGLGDPTVLPTVEVPIGPGGGNTFDSFLAGGSTGPNIFTGPQQYTGGNVGGIVTMATMVVSTDTTPTITIEETPPATTGTPFVTNTGPIVTLTPMVVTGNRVTNPTVSVSSVTLNTPTISVSLGTPTISIPQTTPAATVSVSITPPNPFTPAITVSTPSSTPSVTSGVGGDWWRNYLREGTQTLGDLNQLYPGMLDLYTKASQGYSGADADRLAALSGQGGKFSAAQGNLNDLAAKQTLEANSAIRAGNFADAKRFADQAEQLKRQANPELYGAMQQFQGAAGGQVAADLAKLQQAQARQLSPEDIRNAQQAAREAYSARGLVMGPGAIGSEILNRENLARQREQEARQNLAGSMGQLYQGIGARTANVFDPLAATLGQQYGMQTSNVGMTSNLMNQLGQLAAGGYGNQYVQNQYNPFNPYAQDVYNTNFNARAAQQLAAANNAAALEAARIQAEGAKSAGQTSALSQVGSAILPNILKAIPFICWVAREVYGEDNPKWLMFRHWTLNHAPESFRNWYLNNGEAFAEWLKANAWAKPAIRAFMDSRINSMNQSEIIKSQYSHAL